jgi:class 3 adenylate cyclase
VIVLCSEATYRAAGEAAEGDPVGEHHLTGREGTVRVWRLR